MLSSYPTRQPQPPNPPIPPLVNTYINRLGLPINRAPKILGLIPIHKLRLDAQPRKEDFELVIRAAVQVRRGNDVVACGREGRDGDELRGLAGCCGECCDAAFEGRDALFEDVDGRVHDAAVDVAKFFEAEEPCAVGGVIEGEGLGIVRWGFPVWGETYGCCVDGYGAGIGCWVGDLTCTVFVNNAAL